MKKQARFVGALVFFAVITAACIKLERRRERIDKVWPGDSVMQVKRHMEQVSYFINEVTRRGNFAACGMGYFYADGVYFRSCRTSKNDGYLKSDICNYDHLLCIPEKEALLASIDSLRLLGVYGSDYSSVFHAHFFSVKRNIVNHDDYRSLCLEEQIDTVDFKKGIDEIMDRKSGVLFLKPKHHD